MIDWIEAFSRLPAPCVDTGFNSLESEPLPAWIISPPEADLALCVDMLEGEALNEERRRDEGPAGFEADAHDLCIRERREGRRDRPFPLRQLSAGHRLEAGAHQLGPESVPRRWIERIHITQTAELRPNLAAC